MGNFTVRWDSEGKGMGTFTCLKSLMALLWQNMWPWWPLENKTVCFLIVQDNWHHYSKDQFLPSHELSWRSRHVWWINTISKCSIWRQPLCHLRPSSMSEILQFAHVSKTLFTEKEGGGRRCLLKWRRSLEFFVARSTLDISDTAISKDPHISFTFQLLLSQITDVSKWIFWDQNFILRHQ